MKAYSLSYVLTTFNKCDYLKMTLPGLILACQEDEEIVIVDGGSKDGTVNYLTALYTDGKVHQFISEPDYGEAHGTNKAILMARGLLIKLITDDDAFSYPAIAKCKSFMMNHEEIDILGSNGSAINFISTDQNQFVFKNGTPYFQQWQRNRTPFLVTGLGLMIRKSSIPLLGLFDVNFMIIDFEYTLRNTSGKAKIAWYTGCLFVNIVNQNSNSGLFWQRLNEEKSRLDSFYGRPKYFLINQYLKLRIAIGNLLRKKKSIAKPALKKLDYAAVFRSAHEEIERHARIGEFIF